ncbi:stalk domain-containing protein [Paenibacillus sp. YN15]|uniref:stalk domain-containing protein n=1 Tax=Paenibacillus sp. YN15 TaxID=1742774 RepID=UPI000DCD5D99|nr:stalk domain-containing protein [Paenibacillus sp. YN15]RAU94317.1 hypothetical protein DQG13_23970 [Paenibacillus sp. YN15]
MPMVNKMQKWVAGACAAAISFCAFAVPAAHAEVSPLAETLTVKVQVNSNLIQFPDAQPFIDDQGRTQVPVRFVSEELGYQVDWSRLSDGQINVQLKNDAGKTLTLETGKSTAVVDGKAEAMDTAAVLRDGRVYVPLRFISESKGIRVQWDSNNFIAILNEDGNYHAPAWYATRMKLLSTFTATAYSADPKENGGYGAVDYFGNPLKVGTVAVDPAVIPLGTKLYVEGYDFNGLPAGGMYAEATDTGNALKGNRIDLFVPGSREELKKFGFQQVKVYLLP